MVLADWWDRVAGARGEARGVSFSVRGGGGVCDAGGGRIACAHVERGRGAAVGDLSGRALATCPFAYLRSFDHLFEAALSEAPDPLVVNRVLMLGGAGFAYPKQLLLEHPGVALDVVEIDPAMVQIARERFFLDRLEMQLAAEGRAGDLRIFVEDGEAFLRRSDGAPYDAIINDVFVGARRCRSSPATRALLAPART